MFLASAIAWLLQAIVKVFQFLVEFLIVLFLGIVWIVLLILPWALRLASILAWLGGMYLVMTVIQSFYGSFTPDFPLTALKSGPVIIGVGVLVLVAASGNANHIWGALLTTGLGLIGFAKAVPKLLDIPNAELALRAAPGILTALFTFYITFRFGPEIRAQRLGSAKDAKDATETEEGIPPLPLDEA